MSLPFACEDFFDFFIDQYYVNLKKPHLCSKNYVGTTSFYEHKCGFFKNFCLIMIYKNYKKILHVRMVETSGGYKIVNNTYFKTYLNDDSPFSDEFKS